MLNRKNRKVFQNKIYIVKLDKHVQFEMKFETIL